MLIGTAGHIDHGKTTLVRALTGVDADRLPEEKARGITLDLGYAYAPLDDGSVLGFVDVPGHEKLIRNMLAGITGIDFVLLVIAADDGPMPQTREHLELIDLLDLTVGAVALTKTDVVAPERLETARAEVTDLLAGSGLSGSPVVAVSSRTGEGVEGLREHLEQAAKNFSRPVSGGRFRLAIDRVFSLAGVGTVVTGTAQSGAVTEGDSLTLSPGDLNARVRGLHVQDRAAERGEAGDRCAIAIRGDFEKSDIARGMWLADPALAIPLTRFHGELRVPWGQDPLRPNQSVHVHIGTDDIVGRVAALDCDEVPAGSTALVEIRLERPTLVLRGDRFVLRDAGARRSVAGGRVLDIFPPTRHKRAPRHLALLDTLRADDPAVALTHLARETVTGIDLTRFALAWNLSGEQAGALADRCGLRLTEEGASRTAIDPARWDRLGKDLLAALAGEHERAPGLIGVERDRLRRMTAPGMAPPAFNGLVAELLETGTIAQTRAWLHLPDHRASLTEADRDDFAELKPLLDASPYNPPRVRDVANASGIAEPEVRRLFKRVSRAGELFPVAHDHYFTAQAVAELAEIVRDLSHGEDGAARAARFRDTIFADGRGGRKVAIRILEFFDRVGYTRRVRDDHLLRPSDDVHPWNAT